MLFRDIWGYASRGGCGRLQASGTNPSPGKCSHPSPNCLASPQGPGSVMSHFLHEFTICQLVTELCTRAGPCGQISRLRLGWCDLKSRLRGVRQGQRTRGEAAGVLPRPASLGSEPSSSCPLLRELPLASGSPATWEARPHSQRLLGARSGATTRPPAPGTS